MSDRYAFTTISHQGRQETGSKFCARCGMPGPWLSRTQLIEWVQNLLKASSELSGAERQELLVVLRQVADIGAERYEHRDRMEAGARPCAEGVGGDKART